MYVSADQACSGPTGRIPPSPESVARDRAYRANIQRQVGTANAEVKALVNRDWRDFVSSGPQVAWQVLNQPAPAYDVSVVGSPVPIGVEVAGGGDAASGGNSSRVWIPGKRKNGPKTAGTLDEKQAFVQAFDGNVNPGWQIYTGPLPGIGSAGSLVYGGSPSNRSPVFSTQPAVTPNAAAGYYRGSCPIPVGVEAIPLGENYADAAASTTTTESTVSNATMWAIAGILGLAAVSFLTEKHTERKSRKAAK